MSKVRVSTKEYFGTLRKIMLTFSKFEEEFSEYLLEVKRDPDSDKVLLEGADVFNVLLNLDARELRFPHRDIVDQMLPIFAGYEKVALSKFMIREIGLRDGLPLHYIKKLETVHAVPLAQELQLTCNDKISWVKSLEKFRTKLRTRLLHDLHGMLIEGELRGL